IAGLYAELLRSTGVGAPDRQEESDVAHLYVIRTARRDAIRAALAAHGIATEVHYPLPDYRQAAHAHSSWANCELPVTEAGCREVLTLPCFPEMRDDEVAA